MTLYIQITFLQILTRGHVATIHQLGDKIILAALREGKDRTMEEEIDDAVTEHADMMSFSNKTVGASLYALLLGLDGGVAAMVSVCIIFLEIGGSTEAVRVCGSWHWPPCGCRVLREPALKSRSELQHILELSCERNHVPGEQQGVWGSDGRPVDVRLG